MKVTRDANYVMTMEEIKEFVAAFQQIGGAMKGVIIDRDIDEGNYKELSLQILQSHIIIGGIIAGVLEKLATAKFE